MFKIIKISFILMLLIFTSKLYAVAENLYEDEYVSISLNQLVPDKKYMKYEVVVNINDDYTMYAYNEDDEGQFFDINVLGDSIRYFSVEWPDFETKTNTMFGISLTTNIYKNLVRFPISVTLNGDDHDISVNLDYILCGKGRCLPNNVVLKSIKSN